MDLYSILEVKENSTLNDIKKAYKKLALKYHPDKTNDKSTSKFIEISNAYNILSDENKRKEYNNILKNSNYQKDEWCKRIDLLYHDFLKNNKEKLTKYKYYYKL